MGLSFKWKKLAEDMRVHKIGIMTVQETHLSQEHELEIDHCYPHLRVINTAFPPNPTGAGGVAIVLNRAITDVDSAQSHVLVQGRAIVVKFNWHRGDELTILAVYAPTDKNENAQMWADIEEALKSEDYPFQKPDLMLGDFNFVEDAVDRFPASLHDIDCPDSFDSLKRYLQVYDSWRRTFPNLTEWTWRNAARTSMSRIDRVYATPRVDRVARNWAVTITGITRSDHSRVSLEISDSTAPEIGPGRWTMRSNIVQNDAFIDEVMKLGWEVQQEIERLQQMPRSALRNAQTLWHSFKAEVAGLAKDRVQIIACKRARLMKTLQDRRKNAKKELRRARNEEDSASASQSLRLAEAKITALRESQFNKTFNNRSARTWAVKETMTKSWFSWARNHVPRDTIACLEVPGTAPPQYSSVTERMAEIGRAHHDLLQQDRAVQTDAERQNAIARVLASVERTLKPDTAANIGRHIEREEVDDAVRTAKNGSAAGLDGLIYELWKEMRKRFKQLRPEDKVRTDIVAILLALFTDIYEHGVSPNTGFAAGWLCPLYKKGDRSKIANYRPITLLNTDYKLLTKVLASRLAEAAPGILHPSQAGFVRGRSITDQTKLTTLMLAYAEAHDEGGMIVALDQEKAYDKVEHDYLLATLAAYGLPAAFISVVETLYSDANTAVMLNGHLSRPFKVTRGVRQGDPLSCLLFDIAIEPLPSLLRCSALRGFQIDGLPEKLIASLYADDTTVYLSEHDDYGELLRILDTWCEAAGARFNIAKTEIIPIGPVGYRAELLESRRLNPGTTPVPAGIRIARDGEVTRILGAWPGNMVVEANAWSVMLEKVQARLDKWEKSQPSLNGRALLTHTVIGGYSQYLTAAQGMPPRVERKLEQMTLDFFWEGSKRHPVNMATLRLPKWKGGLNLLDVRSRNDAQYLAWVGAYLSPPETRPLWAWVADKILRARMIIDQRGRLPVQDRLDPLTQDWRPNVHRLPLVLKKLVTTARRHGLRLDAAFIGQRTRETVRVWAHHALLTPRILHDNRAALRCLRTKHAVSTVEDLEEIADADEEDHEGVTDCLCSNCVTDRGEGCRAPYKCAALAGDLLGDIDEKWNPATPDPDVPCELWDAFEATRMDALDNGELLVFDSRPRPSCELRDLARILGTALRTQPSPDSLDWAPPYGRPPQRTVTALVCAGMYKADTDEARGGYAVHFPDEEYMDLYSASSAPDPSFTQTSAFALCDLIHTVDPNDTLHIVMTSKFVVKALTLDLHKHEDAGWTTVPLVADTMRAAVAALRSRAAETTLTYVDKKRSKLWQDLKDTKAAALTAAELSEASELDLALWAHFDNPGVRANTLNQRRAHLAIKMAAVATTPVRRTTSKNVWFARSSVRIVNGAHPTERQLWMGLRSRDLGTNTRNFLWKGLHGAHKVGDYFEHMPEPWRAKRLCPTCAVTETIEHILFTCPDSKQAAIWHLVHKRLAEKDMDMDLDAGLVWGCASVRMPDAGSERFFRIVVSESAFLIWKLRCEKRIAHADDPDWRLSSVEAGARWAAVMKARRLNDRRLQSSKRYGNLATDPELVKDTWRHPGERPDAIEQYIAHRSGVLVGRDGRAPTGVG